MLAPISLGRRDNHTSFAKLKNYLTRERDPETGEEIERGEIILSENLLSLDSAHLEMMATASQNKRNEDPVYHYQIAWQPGERPSRDQWEEAAKQTLAALGYSEHQYLIAAHDDKAHFHVHIMVNKIHPETYRAHTPRRDMFTLDEQLRELENRHGWNESPGLYHWDKTTRSLVKNTRDEMDAIRNKSDRSRGKAGEFAHYHDAESLQGYVKKTAALEVTSLLARQRVGWSDLHRVLAKHGLELHKGDQGGYTVGAIGTDLRCKASDVFRRSFAGKINREATETKLGPWVAATDTDRNPASASERYEKRKDATEQRKVLREEREKARVKLKMRFGAYREQCKSRQKLATTIGYEKRLMLTASLKNEKAAIRAMDVPWREKRALLSQAVAKSVLENRALKVEVMRVRLEDKSLTYQEWVTREAQQGDLAAAAQVRGWRYTDQRNVRKAEVLVNSQRDAVHLSSASTSRDPDYDDLMNGRLAELRRNEQIAATLKAANWSINRRTGDVHYTVHGALALVDRGKTISVLNSEENAIVLGLEMSVKKYGSVLNVEGSQIWKERVAKVAARNGVFVKFTDPSMQRTMLIEQIRLDRYGVMSKQLADLQVRVSNAPEAAFQLSSPEAAQVLMAGIYGAGNGRKVVDRLLVNLKTGNTPATLNVKELFNVEARLSSEGTTPVFTVRPLPGKGIALANALKAGSLKMSQLSEAERSTRPQQPQEGQRKGRDFGR